VLRGSDSADDDAVAANAGRECCTLRGATASCWTLVRDAPTASGEAHDHR